MKAFTPFYANLKDQLSSKACHTNKAHNYDCPDTPAKTLRAIATSRMDSLDKHKFYKAPSCVKDIMGGVVGASSGFAIFKSLFVLFALIAYSL
jgi:hypothetical protein